MEDLLLALLEPLLGLFLELFLELFGELVLDAFSAFAAGVLRELVQAWMIGPAVSAIGLLLAGGAAGILSALAVPYRLIVIHVAFPGLSLLLAPLAAGSAMYVASKLLRRFGWRFSILATFGGSLFAFSMALARWWIVGPYH